MPVIPTSVIAVIVSIAIAFLFKKYAPHLTLESSQLVNIPTNILNGGNIRAALSHPVFNALNNPDFYVLAFTIALVASIETILCIQAIDKLDPKGRTTFLNRELIAQGTGNMISGILG